ncbi:hypothetical protein MHLP_03950 [Candidatus Mycoplasma haematolamae str. Purdue]|uniref:Uncharacterized protein n=1 Tax=Mycoplasma haematolamae (strain Purdue) TaxID=1212765 RepID=I7BAM1_MYCHA|nr:hypothetical protein MHLP_03950 [Candidatus Mycoplasma haematolamae str. Purdue]
MGIGKLFCSIAVGAGTIGGGGTCIVLDKVGYFEQAQPNLVSSTGPKAELGKNVSFKVTVNSDEVLAQDCMAQPDKYMFLWIERDTANLEDFQLVCSSIAQQRVGEVPRYADLTEVSGSLGDFKCTFKGLDETEASDKKAYKYECLGGNPLLKGEKKGDYIALKRG